MSTPANYKQERLQKQIEWHSKKAQDNKIRFQIVTIIASTAAASLIISGLFAVLIISSKISKKRRAI